MATRSTIVLRLNDEDKGKNYEFNPSMLTDRGITFTKKYPIPSVELKGRYMEVYHHWDGYPEGVGSVLVDTFNQYDDILNLLSMGDMSSIGGEVCSYRGWRNEDTPPSFSDNEPSCSEEYIYLFENGKWYFKDDCEITEWTDLEEYLSKE